MTRAESKSQFRIEESVQSIAFPLGKPIVTPHPIPPRQ